MATWAALVLTLLAIPLSILHRPLAAALLVLAVVLLLTVKRRRGLFRVVAVLTGAAVVLTGVSVASMARPRSTAGPERAVYARQAGPSREVAIPLTVAAQPVSGVVLMNFPAGSDPLYYGLEPQVIDEGVRVVAYRHDGRTDVYDDATLPPRPTDDLSVTGAGMANYVHAPMRPASIGGEDEQLIVDIAFTDVAGRLVEVSVDSSLRGEQPFPLLAPVGGSSTAPGYLPLFMLNDFHFLRSEPTVLIDGATIPIEPFPAPIPIQGHLRSGARYALDTDMLEVFPTRATEMRRASTVAGTDTVVDGETTYLFHGQALERILIRTHEILFEPPLSPGAGTMTITSWPDRGVLTGSYELDGTTLTIDITEVRLPRQRDISLSLMTSALPFFSWPTGYSYSARIDKDAGTIDGRWSNS